MRKLVGEGAEPQERARSHRGRRGATEEARSHRRGAEPQREGAEPQRECAKCEVMLHKKSYQYLVA